MRISKREVNYLYRKKIKEGMTPSQAYNQIAEEFKFLNSLPNEKKKLEEEKVNIKDFKNMFKDLKQS